MTLRIRWVMMTDNSRLDVNITPIEIDIKPIEINKQDILNLIDDMGICEQDILKDFPLYSLDVEIEPLNIDGLQVITIEH